MGSFYAFSTVKYLHIYFRENGFKLLLYIEYPVFIKVDY